jgi:transposase
VAYSPQYNPIEIVWSQVKASFKRAKLKLLAQGASINYERLSIQSLLNVDAAKISSICRKVIEREILQVNK